METVMKIRLTRAAPLVLISAAMLCNLPATADPALDAAMKACDEAAGTPMSGVAGVPEVYSRNIKIADDNFKVDMAKYKPMFDACFAAASSSNAHPRFRYQLARLQAQYGVVDFDSKALIATALPIIEEYAAKGWPDAQYTAAEVGLISRLRDTPEGRQALARNLLAAADAGHLDALSWAAHHLMQRDSAFFKPNPPDPLRAAKYLAVLAKDAPPPPLKGDTTWQDRARYDAKLRRARIVANIEGFSGDEQHAAFETFKAYSDAGDVNGKLSYATSLERGRATDKNLPLAMKLYEELSQLPAPYDQYVAADAAASLAALLLTDAAGTPDPARARSILEASASQSQYISPSVIAVLAPMLTDGKNFVREPRRAFEMLEKGMFHDPVNILLAELLLQTDYKTKEDARLIANLSRLALNENNKQAAMALGRLAAAEKYPYKDAPESLKALVPFAAKDMDARLLLARLTLRNLSSTTFKVFIATESPMSEKDILAALKDGEAQNHPEALVIKALMLRRGLVFPQDDRGATKLLIKAAELGNVEAMVLAAEAYREGLGVKRDDQKAVTLWRAAAKAGSLAGREALVWNFSFLKEIGMEEQVGIVMSLFANGEGFRFGERLGPAHLKLAGVFTNGRMLQSQPSSIAKALLSGFRHVPAALEDEIMIAIIKSQTDEVRIAVEAELKREGFYKGEPEGFFDPEVRDALRAYVKAKGPLVSVLAE
jgi:hypothetical protein